MSKHKKPLKLTKKVEVPVNPIVFGCNALVEKHIDSTIGHSSETNPIVKSLLDGKTLHKKRRLKVLPVTIAALERLGQKFDLEGAFGCPINEYLCDSCIYPGDGCKYRKLSERATKFLLSLGAPTDELRVEYRAHLCSMANERPFEIVDGMAGGQFYEEMLELPINGRTEYLYLIASPEMCHVIHRRDPRSGLNEYMNIPVLKEFRERELLGATRDYDEQYDNATTGNVFDSEGFLTNLWIAENLKTCEVCMEPETVRHAADRPVILAGKKPLKHSQAYRYIHITDETWAKYESASTAVREQKNFTVPSWLVRAHYARMHGKTVLIKAHYAYRRKGTVTAESVDYIV